MNCTYYLHVMTYMIWCTLYVHKMYNLRPSICSVLVGSLFNSNERKINWKSFTLKLSQGLLSISIQLLKITTCQRTITPVFFFATLRDEKLLPFNFNIYHPTQTARDITRDLLTCNTIKRKYQFVNTSNHPNTYTLHPHTRQR